MLAWCNFRLAKRIPSARERGPLKRKDQSRSVLAYCHISQPTAVYLNWFSLAKASAGGNGSRWLPPRPADRYDGMSDIGAQRADQQLQRHSQKRLPLFTNRTVMLRDFAESRIEITKGKGYSR